MGFGKAIVLLTFLYANEGRPLLSQAREQVHVCLKF